jgi:hypothetical protein
MAWPAARLKPCPFKTQVFPQTVKAPSPSVVRLFDQPENSMRLPGDFMASAAYEKVEVGTAIGL